MSSHLPASKDLQVAREAAQAGGTVLARYFRSGVEARAKGDEGLITIADTTAEDAIAAVIRAALPGDAILAEESHRDDATAPRVWVVDPLDGTTNFAHGLAHFAVSIALWCDGRPEVGVVLDPIAGTWHEAVRGHGAYRDGARLQCADTSRIEDALVATGFNYDRAATLEPTLDAIRSLMLGGIRGVRRFGTASLDLCLLASGSFSAFFEYRLAPWDFAAGCLLAQEAGAVATTIDGAPLRLRSSGVLAAPPALHGTMMDVLAAAVPIDKG